MNRHGAGLSSFWGDLVWLICVYARKLNTKPNGRGRESYIVFGLKNK